MSAPGSLARDIVGVSLAGSEEARAAIAVLKAQDPSITVRERGGYYKVERPGSLEFDLPAIARVLGRPLSAYDFLVNVSSYYGRIDVGDELVRIVAEILPGRFADAPRQEHG